MKLPEDLLKKDINQKTDIEAQILNIEDKNGIDGIFSSVNSYPAENCLDYATRNSSVYWPDNDVKENKDNIWIPGNTIILIIYCDDGNKYITTQRIVSRESLLPQSYYIDYKGIDGQKMRLPRDLFYDQYMKPDIFLCSPDKTKICKLEVEDLNGTFNFKKYSEITFSVNRFYKDDMDGCSIENNYYKFIKEFKYIYLDKFGYFELQAPEIIDDGINERKNCTAFSSEYTLSKNFLNDFNINTGEIDSLEVMNSNGAIIPIVLYDPNNKKNSLLDIVLSYTHGWEIGKIDESLKKLVRNFRIDRKSVYDFFLDDIQKKFNCYVDFDNINNKINIYAEQQSQKFLGDGIVNKFYLNPIYDNINIVSVNGYKTTEWEYDNINGTLTMYEIPKKGDMVEVVDSSMKKWDTDVFINYDNLAQNMKISYDTDSIKTLLYIYYGEDKDIREINFGLPYIVDLSYYRNKDDMGEDLFNAYSEYLISMQDVRHIYEENSKKLLDLQNQINYIENRMSLYYEIANDITPSTQGIYYIKGGSVNDYYIEIKLPKDYNSNQTYYKLKPGGLNEDKVSSLYSCLKKYFNADDSWLTDITNLKDQFSFMSVFTIDYLIDNLSGNGDINSQTEVINNFLNEMWNQLGSFPLNKFYLDSYKQIQIANIEAGWSDVNNENYWSYYPNILFINSLEHKINNINQQIKLLEDEYKKIYEENKQISQNSNIKKYFKEYFYNIYGDENKANDITNRSMIILNSFLNEDELRIEDIIETSQDTPIDSLKIKKYALEEGKLALQKSSQPKLKFQMDMANIYAIKEFSPIIDQFQLGNVVNIEIRKDYIKKSRLLSVNINFEDFSDFHCEFGDLYNFKSQLDIQADLLSEAITSGQNVTKQHDYWTKGSDQANLLGLQISKGLLDAATQIKSTDGTQDVLIDKYGIRLQKKNENEEIDPKQVWMVNNQIVFTDDNFNTSKAALGNFKFYNPETQRDEWTYGVMADTLIGNLILSEKVGIYNKNNNISLGENGFIITSNGKEPGTNRMMFTIQKEGESGIKKIFYIDEDGNLSFDGSSVKINVNSQSSILPDYITQQAQSEINEYSKIVDEKISNLKNQIDGQQVTWFIDEDPTVDNFPAKDWNDEQKKEHIDDLCYNKISGIVYRWTGSNWEKLQDKDIARALEQASKAQDTADKKRRTFVSEPKPPYDVGDLWINDNSPILVCKIKKLENEAYSVDDWEKSDNYVDDKTFEPIKKQVSTLETNVNGISGKVESSVGSVVVMYALGESREVAPTDGWNVVAPYNDGSHFMWQRTITTLNNGDVKTTETCISGADGKNGKKGIDGVFSSVNSYTIEECLDYATRLSTVSWSDAEIKENKNGIWLPNNIIILTISCDNGDQYITTQKVISRNSLLPQSYYINYKGVDGLGIDNIVNQYYLSTSDTKVEGGEWLYNQPKWEADKTIWIRQEITWEDGNKTYTNPVQERALNDASKNIVLLKQNVSDLQLTSTSIKGTVSTLTTSLNDNTKGINEEIKKQNETIATLTSNKVFLQLKEKVDNGVKSIETETGYKFDRDGLTISKSNQEMTTQITENGMYVKRNNEAVLTANNAGVDAVNLHATTYLIVGKNSRFEDFGDQTACFWIGG